MARILVIDDELAGQVQAEVSLAPEHEVHIVPSKADAIAALRQAVFDLLVVDLNLQDSHGLSILEALQQYSAAPVLIVTAGLGLAEGAQQDRIFIKLRLKHELLDRTAYLAVANSLLAEAARAAEGGPIA